VNWWDKQISLGWKGPMGRPRGSEDAAFPLRSHVRYRVSMNPSKAHLLQPGTDHAFCGLTLAPRDGDLIDSGYDAWYWIVEETRQDSNNCGPCSQWKSHWFVATGKALPTDSPVSAGEWQTELGPAAEAAGRQMDVMAAMVAGWFGGEARVVEEEQ